jgi:hypothetical protein
MGAPAILDAQSDRVLSFLNSLAVAGANKAPGAIVSDGGTTQATGANTAPNLDLDVTAHHEAVVGGSVLNPVSAATDVDSNAGDDVVWGATSGKTLLAAVVLLANSTYVVIPGAVANTGAQVAPTDDEISADVDVDGVAFVRIADVAFSRTGDTSITVAVDHTVRDGEVGTFGNGFATTEAEFSDTGAARVTSVALS